MIMSKLGIVTKRIGRLCKPSLAITLAGLGLLPLSLLLEAQNQTAIPVPRSYFGMTVMRQRLSPKFDYGTTRSWDAWPRLDWAAANPSKGVYNFAALDIFLRANNNQNKDLIYTLGMTPQWASSQPDANYGGQQPGTCAPPTNIQDWDNYVRAVVSHAAGRIKYWEIWNEPNLQKYYCGDIPTLVLLSQHTRRVVKGIDPSALILSPAVTGVGGPAWLSSYFSQGGTSSIDVVAFHGYLKQQAEDIVPLIQSYKTIMAANGISRLPLWDDEDDNKVAQTPEQESAFLAKSYLLQWSSGVSRFVWYAFDADPEWGRLYDPVTNQPSSAAKAYAEVYSWMVGASLVGPCSKDASGNWSCLFKDDGSQKEAIWNSNKSMPTRVPAQFHRYRDLSGKTYSITNGAVPVGNLPILLISATQ